MEREPGFTYEDGIVDIFILPFGHLPERKTPGAIGYDVYARALVSSKKKDEQIRIFESNI